ncbi:hypothetical protein QTP86_016718, partial [Hemibagrus guttatus]
MCRPWVTEPVATGRSGRMPMSICSGPYGGNGSKQTAGAHIPGSRLSMKNLRLKIPCRKLSLRYIGPFHIIRQVNPVMYRLLLLITSHPPSMCPCSSQHTLAKRHWNRLLYLVDLEGYGPEECSWVDADDILDPLLVEEFH